MRESDEFERLGWRMRLESFVLVELCAFADAQTPIQRRLVVMPRMKLGQ